VNQTGPHFRLRSLYRQSMPGSHVNEDGAGLHGRFAWVIDGATGIANRQATSGATDAAWLADTLDRTLAGLAPAVESGRLFKGLEASIRHAFDAESDHRSLPDDEHAPSACLGFIWVRDGAEPGRVLLQGAFLGDVVALVPTAEGIVRWTDERAKPFERRTLAALGDADRHAGTMPEAVRRQILENRTKLNHPDGYWVVNPRRSWAGREVRFEATIAPGQPIVLATDGFMRLVDVFAAYSKDSLHARLAAGEGDDLIRELREREREDAPAYRYPRVKIHDDATVQVVAAEPCGRSDSEGHPRRMPFGGRKGLQRRGSST
jgi:hypothetical protein